MIQITIKQISIFFVQLWVSFSSLNQQKTIQSEYLLNLLRGISFLKSCNQVLCSEIPIRRYRFLLSGSRSFKHNDLNFDIKKLNGNNTINKQKLHAMKLSIRTRVAFLMIILFLIILVLSVLSGYHLNKLTNKTSKILEENYLSIVYAREMSDGIMIINEEITSCFLSGMNPDSLLIIKEIGYIDNSLYLEKNNITDPGEDKLVSAIETDYSDFRNAVTGSMNLPKSANNVLYLQHKSGELFQQLVLLSEMNGKSIENKTDDTKVYAKKAFEQMSVLGTLFFMIALVFMFNFARYFNDRFFLLRNGIKELLSSNYGQRLYFDGEDEFSEIALSFNKMAEKLSEDKKDLPLTKREDSDKEIISHDVKGLEEILTRIKTIEEQVSGLISKFKSE